MSLIDYLFSKQLSQIQGRLLKMSEQLDKLTTDLQHLSDKVDAVRATVQTLKDQLANATPQDLTAAIATVDSLDAALGEISASVPAAPSEPAAKSSSTFKPR
jgi:uncharacterized protein YoxC